MLQHVAHAQHLVLFGTVQAGQGGRERGQARYAIIGAANRQVRRLQASPGCARIFVVPQIYITMSSLETIQRMLVEQFDLPLDALTPDAKLDILGVDSLSVLEFMFSLEDHFKIKLTEERVEINTLQDIADLVDKLLAQQEIHS